MATSAKAVPAANAAAKPATKARAGKAKPAGKVAKKPAIPAVSTELAKSLTAWSVAKTTADKEDVKIGDVLIAAGIKPAMLETPKKDSPLRAFFDKVQLAIIMGKSKAIIAMLTGSPDALIKSVSAGKAGKTALPDLKDVADRERLSTGNRRYWQQRLGSDMRDLKLLLERRVEKDAKAKADSEWLAKAAAAIAAGKKAPKKPQASTPSLEQRFLKTWEDQVKKLKEAESTKFDLFKVKDLLTQLVALLKPVVTTK
jgi:hypothetical protein